MSRRRRAAAVLTTLAASAALSACGGHDIRHEADDEGLYVDVGHLQYQVQISRQLNPFNVEDRSYLVGLSQFDGKLPANQVYFGVFLQADNSGSKGAQSAKSFSLTDTQQNKFTPIQLGQGNVFAYRPEVVPAKGGLQDGLNPAANSSAYTSSTQGALLLFKVPESSLANRPLQLHIASPVGGPEGTVDLDV